jgi:tRNA/rRNA methyltransferase
VVVPSELKPLNKSRDILLSNCRVVLVRPEVAGNIGATARAMRNFGLKQLVLVDPVAKPSDPEARRLSTHGEAILDAATIIFDLPSAVADCILVAGTSARVGGLYRDDGRDRPDIVMPKIVASLQRGPAAIVFGPEPSGLTNAEISLCHALIRLPADAEYPVLNLAQAVVICLYELFRSSQQAVVQQSEDAPAQYEDRERMFAHLRSALEQIHFLYGDKADPLMHGIRRLISKAAPTEMEIGLLHGLARQMEWIAARSGTRESSDERG